MEENLELKKEEQLTPASLIKLAIENNADLQQLEKLIELKERWEKSEAEKAFNLSMAKFQKECPVINKSSTVKDKHGKERYKFAPLGEIVKQVSSFIADNELFYDFKTEQADEFLTVICTVTHSKGHSKDSAFRVPIGKEEYMTDVQKYGARQTFAKRYAFCNAFGIMTADEDTDTEGQPDKLTEELQTELNECLTELQLKEFWDGHKSLQTEKWFIESVKNKRGDVTKKAEPDKNRIKLAIGDLKNQTELSGLNAAYVEYKDLKGVAEFDQAYLELKTKLVRPTR